MRGALAGPACSSGEPPAWRGGRGAKGPGDRWLVGLGNGARAGGPVVAVSRLLGAVGGERRGRVIGGWFVWSTGRRLGRSLMDTLRPPGKPFAISKWEVWEAYRQVKANKGAPGADGCSPEGV